MSNKKAALLMESLAATMAEQRFAALRRRELIVQNFQIRTNER